MQKKLLQEINSIVKKYDKDIKDIEADDLLKDVVIDDLSKVQIMMEIERKFNVDFDMEHFDTIKSASDLIEYLKEKGRYV